MEQPEMTFHIAANTLVSDKLNQLGERENVNIYSCVSLEKAGRTVESVRFLLGCQPLARDTRCGERGASEQPADHGIREHLAPPRIACEGLQVFGAGLLS